MGLSVTVDEIAPGCKILRAVGQIDHHTVAYWEKSLREAIGSKPKALVINMANVTAISSSGSGALLSCLENMEKSDIMIVLVGVDGEGKQSLKLMGLLELFSSAATEGEALERAATK